MTKPTCPTDTKLELIEALQRRGLALHLAGLMPFKYHEQWTAGVRHMMDPINISGFVSVANVIKADRELWNLIRGSTSKGIRKEGVGNNAEYPLWIAMKRHMNDFFVDRLLVPSQNAPSGQASKRKRRETSEDSASAKDHPRPKREGKWSKQGGKAKGKGKHKGKSGGKGKAKGGKAKGKGKKGKSGAVPKELIGLSPTTRAGAPICFPCQSKWGCQHAKGGQTCWKGLHVCMKCGACDHGAFNCSKA